MPRKHGFRHYPPQTPGGLGWGFGRSPPQWAPAALMREASNSSRCFLACTDIAFSPCVAALRRGSNEPVAGHLFGRGEVGAQKAQLRLARHAGIEALDGADDIDAGEILRSRPVRLDDRGVEHRLLHGARLAAGRARPRIDARRDRDLIVGELGAFEHRPMRQHPAPRAAEADAETPPRPGQVEGTAHARLALRDQRLGARLAFQDRREIEGYGIGARAVALEGVPDLGNAPFQPIEDEARTRGMHEAALGHLRRERRYIETRIGADLERASVPGERRRPAIGARLGGVAADRLVPGMVGTERVAQRIGGVIGALPRIVEGTVYELLHPGIEGAELGRDQRAVDDRARRRPALLAPDVAVLVSAVVERFVVPLAEIDEIGGAAPEIAVARLARIEEIEYVVPDPRATQRIVAEGAELRRERIELLHAEGERDAAGHDRFGMRILPAEQRVSRARQPHHVERFREQPAARTVQLR